MQDLKRYLAYGLIGVSAGWVFYKFTRPGEIEARPAEEEREYVLVKIPIPKTVGESNLREIIERIKPSRVIPSFRPLGVTLQWDPIYVETAILPIGYAPPSKFISGKDVVEIKRKIEALQPQIVDKGLYWEVSLKIKV